MFQAVLISTNPGRLQTMQQLVLETGQIESARLLSEYPSGLLMKRLINTLDPDLILVDLDESDISVPFAAEVLKQAPEIAMVGLRSEPGPNVAGIGVAATYGITAAELLQSVERELLRKRTKPLSNVHALIPAKGGAGSSTVAWNTAVALASAGRKVLLLDTDLRSGVLSFVVNTKEPYSLQDMLRRPVETQSFLMRNNLASAHGVDLLLSDRTEVHPPPRWDSYLAFLRPMIGRYDAVLLDLPERLDQTLMEILGCCGRVLVVTTPDLVSVRLAERALREIISCGVDEERMEVVLNRWEKGDLNSQQLENHFRVPVTGLIPSDHRTLTASILKSEPLHSQTEIGQAFSRFASTFDSTLKMDTKSVTFGLKFKQMFGAASR